MRRPLPRPVVLGAAAVALVAVVVAVAVVRGQGPDGPTANERDRLAAAVAAADSPAAALDGVADLAADPDRWRRLVAGGGDDLATLLDAAQPALGQEDDPVARAEPVVAPFVAGDGVDDDVAPALGRWAWPRLAADLGSAGAARRAGAVVARVDDERAAVTAAVALARLHRTLTGPADREAIESWRHDLARAAIAGGVADDEVVEDRAGALRSGDLQDQPPALLRAILAAWGPEPPRVTDAARAAIAAATADDEARAPTGSAVTVAAYLAVIDASGDGAAAAVVARLAAGADPLTEGATSLATLEDALLTTDDPALTAATAAATLLRTA
ncbi:MAG TPA: hypothetical protein VFU19_01365 [Iamia sp.]|nr:hypothetical protein [Iamia sp.]